MASPDGVAVEVEILAGRRAFPVTQQLFLGSPLTDGRQIECGWHDTAQHPESGAFALVRAGAGLDDLIGEIARVVSSVDGRQVFVYVLAASGLPVDFSLYRRAWHAIALPSAESLSCDVAVVV